MKNALAKISKKIADMFDGTAFEVLTEQEGITSLTARYVLRLQVGRTLDEQFAVILPVIVSYDGEVFGISVARSFGDSRDEQDNADRLCDELDLQIFTARLMRVARDNGVEFVQTKWYAL